MEPTAAFQGLRCPACERIHALTSDHSCPDCGAACEVAYDYAAVTPAELFDLPDDTESEVGADDPSAPGHWRFDALLPFAASDAVTAGEGGTPLVAADRLAEELDVADVYIKDEGRNPTGTVYDRGMSLAVTALAAEDDPDALEPIALATTGNSGQSAAAYVGRLGLRSYAFVPSRSAFSNKAMINVHGGEMRVVGGRYADAVEAVDEQLATDYYSLQEFTTPYRHEGAKTLAFELYADLGEIPDYVFIPTSTGELIAGVANGFEELTEIGATESTPTIVAVQPTSCAPIATALERGESAPEPWAVPDTIVGELEVPDPAGGPQAVDALQRLDGDAVTVDDADILDSAVTVAQQEVIEMGAAGGAAPAGAWAYDEDGGFDSDETVVLLNTESGAKTPDILRSHLMGGGR
ncbi:pyridoxal-phosphate dependent enzyme [Halonotius terrestris]|uniref:Pyridoxal-phosphate dependent enzyme n=1 Tax=Halonotius terrestris TaxID=2487750 RepID=A0A8J8PCW1_9EURY|nr:pyridoxal-phosphate dependent enzyme [Halonotius terrestris]TQQ82857.1 pyridoxal-phosphate dependent enzyme [Halonotius terrestris]